MERGRRIDPSIALRERYLRMYCRVMVQLIKMLDSVRAEQCKAMRHDAPGEMRRLRAFEAFLDSHERTCATCRPCNPLGTQFVENSIRR